MDEFLSVLQSRKFVVVCSESESDLLKAAKYLKKKVPGSLSNHFSEGCIMVAVPRRA